MVKKVDLRKAMESTPEGNAPAAVSSSPPHSPSNDPHYRPGRVGKTAVSGFFPPPVKRQLRLMAAANDTTIQALLTEALNDLFAKHGKPEIAAASE